MRQLAWLLQVILVPLLAPLFIGIINNLKAKLQKRQGPGLLQQYRNLAKLFHKDEVISRDASWLFRVAPFLVFGVTLVIGASIPLFSTWLHLPTGDFLSIIYLLALGTFFLALAGMDTGSAFGGFGPSREMTIAALAEVSFVFSIFVLTLASGFTNVADISHSVAGGYGAALLPIGLAGAAFIVVLLAENKRYPFDNPDTHLELTMIHEAMILEYSGKRLALMEWAAANKFFIFAALGVNLFFPIGIAQSASLGGVLIGLGALLAKVVVICAAVAVLESITVKSRIFRLPDVLAIAFICNIVAIGLLR